MALKVLSLSPHYFYRPLYQPCLSTPEFLEKEHQRNSISRKKICDQILLPYYLNDMSTVLDYGCGAGYLAKEISKHVRKVFACDISPAVISCAKILNPAENIEYFVVGKDTVTPFEKSRLDLIYSFAVIQHVTDAVFESILKLWFTYLRPKGGCVMHVVLDGKGWRTETEWRSDTSIRGKVKYKWGLNCFTRSPEAVSRMIVAAGFKPPEIIAINELGESDDDIFNQHLCVFTKPG